VGQRLYADSDSADSDSLGHAPAVLGVLLCEVADLGADDAVRHALHGAGDIPRMPLRQSDDLLPQVSTLAAAACDNTLTSWLFVKCADFRGNRGAKEGNPALR
jgi:hypothetical protein